MSHTRTLSRRRAIGATSAVAVVGSFLALPSAAYASSVSSAVFSGGAGTASTGGTLYAKQGAALTLTVVTSSDTKCVDVTGAATLPRQTSSTAKSNWTFTTTAPAGNGAQAFTVAASPNFNTGGCTGQTNSTQASYVVDNTGPVVSADLTPAPTSFGWNNSDVVVKWTATDAGSGVTAAQPFQTDSAITANGIVIKAAPAQSDRLGNTGAAGSVTVRVDKAKPSITAAQTKNADGTTTITFTCDDTGNGGGGGNGEPSGIATCLADGTTTNSKTVAGGVTVTGTATDKAGNTQTATSTAPAGDSTAPVLSGAPTAQPNGAGWYKGDVTVKWTATDPESGIPTQPADTTITGEGTGLTSSQTVRNGAGLSTTATSPAVKIDRTAPSTGISGTSNNWVNGAVNVTLTPTDNLSGIASTSYSINGGAAQSGRTFSLADEGDHAVSFFSTDGAGNAEAAQTVRIKIDKTAPTIAKAFTPSGYVDGSWTNQNVTVTFTCSDQGGSGVANCPAPVTKAAEGKDQQVVGTAADGAGNTASSTALISIDKAPPTITATANGAKNEAGWYKDDVTVSFSANDALSGVASKSDNVVLAQGANQAASGTATDEAGNSASASVTGINVDKADPTLTGTFPAGWNTGDVAVKWTCTDTGGSGVKGAQPADTTVSGEGSNLSATASCEDVAGNAVTKTVTGIKIDRSKPTTEADVPTVPASGWYRSGVPVTLTGSDNLSGATTYYKLNGGAQQTYSAPFTVDTAGTTTVTFWSVDGAGNIEVAPAPIALKIDKTAPDTKVVNPISPDSGWFVTSGIPVAFTATDAGSGVAATYYTIDGGPRQTYGQPFTATLADGEHTISYWSVDLAGNEEARETTNVTRVSIDTVPPTITGSQSPAANGNLAANGKGWNNTPVTVSFSCGDTGSGVQTGVAGCSAETQLSNEGEGQSVTGDAVDVAGNKSRTVYGPVNIDTTKPTLTGAPTTNPVAGWYRGDVDIKWTGVDGLSGIDAQPGNSKITGEGSNLGAGPVTVKDKAGNESAAASVSGIKVDRSAPVITGAATTAPTGGWYKNSVTVDFSATDPALADRTSGSGVAGQPDDKVLQGDGANQSVTSDPVSDLAGNRAPGMTVGGISIDSTAPTSDIDIVCGAVVGFCKGGTASVKVTATDQPGLSGVKEIRTSVNGQPFQTTAGAVATVSVPLAAKSGTATVRYQAVDNAGNVETEDGASLKYDNLAPAITMKRNPAANADGWNNTNLTVEITAEDDSDGSGVDPATVTPNVAVTAETSGQVVAAKASDKAGNEATDTLTVKLDKTAPTITTTVTGTKGANGWYTGPVTVAYTCTDDRSGIPTKTCPADDVITTGENQSVSATVRDAAGNPATATTSGINIDASKPVITVNGLKAIYKLGETAALTCSATDTGSGVNDTGCKVTASGGNANGVGTFTYTATATDKAGNPSTTTGTYKVIYRFDGFLQPINDTAHQVDQSTSIFKGGSTVPVKLQLKRNDGSVVAGGTAQWLNPVKLTSHTAPIDEAAFSDPPMSGTAYKYDATAQQFIYTWGTGKTSTGFYYRIGATLDDGQTYYVNIGLR